MTDFDLTQLDPANLTRTIIDLNAQRLGQIDPALPDLMRACAIPVAFNVEVVSQLVSLSASQLDAATALSHILTLPFIIQRQDGDYTYHDNSRNLMLADWQNDRPRYVAYVRSLVIYYAEQGDRAYKQGNYQATLTWINRALELTNNQPELAEALGHLYNVRGHIQVRLGNYAAAVPDLTQAIEQQVANTETYFDLGVAYYYLNNTQATLIAWGETINLNPQDSDYRLLRGTLYDDLGQSEAALADFNEAIRLNPQYVDVFNNRGTLYQNLGQTEAALADYTETIRLNPQHADAFNNRAILHENLGKNEAALADYAEAIRLNPQHADALINSGLLYLTKLAQYEKAIENFSQYIEINPQDAAAYYNRSCAWALQGQVESALRDLLQAFELDKAQGSTKAITLAQTDSDFDSLRELPAFQALLAEFGDTTAD